MYLHFHYDYTAVKSELDIPSVLPYIQMGILAVIISVGWVYSEELSFLCAVGIILFVLIGFLCHSFFQYFIERCMSKGQAGAKNDERPGDDWLPTLNLSY
jgi:hypothetical protein